MHKAQMYRATLTSLGLAALLASCTLSQPLSTTGRIVNAGSGEEGTVTFLPGALLPGGAPGGDNVTVEIGGQTYRGRAAVLAGGNPATSAFDVSLGVGGSTGRPGSFWDWNARFGTPTTPRAGLRSGNLIARTAGATPRTLTCTLEVDASQRGIGECQGSDGARYALQF
jgi:hypothetical protein